MSQFWMGMLAILSLLTSCGFFCWGVASSEYDGTSAVVWRYVLWLFFFAVGLGFLASYGNYHVPT
jgi:hypothetical protein